MSEATAQDVNKPGYSEHYLWIRWLIITLTIVVTLPLLSTAIFNTWIPDWRWENIPVHAVIEGMGTLAAFIISSLIFSLVSREEISRQYLWVVFALVVMGTLDGFHALLNPGQSFVWLHSIATALGGILFSMVWIPLPKLSSKQILKICLFILFVSTVLGIFSVTHSEYFPAMITAGSFTFAAKIVNMSGGIGFIIGTAYFAYQYIKRGHEEGVIFANHCLLFGVAGLLFEISVLWDAGWWAWHMLRFTAYLVVVVYFLQQFHTLHGFLQKSKDDVKLLLESSGEGIYGVNEKGKCMFANKKALEMTGYNNSEEWLGVNMHDLIHHSYPDGSAYNVKNCRIYEVLVSGYGNTVDDEVFWRKDGSSFPVEYKAFPMLHDNKILGSVVSFSDITERKRAEQELKEAKSLLEHRVQLRTTELEQANRTLSESIVSLEEAKSVAEQANNAKTVFLSSMSHELRTPLNAILGFSQLLEMDNNNPDNTDNINEILSAGNHLLELIGDILDLSQIESGEIMLDLEHTQAFNALDEAIQMILPIAKQQNITVNTDAVLDTPTPQVINTDKTRLKQILINLLSNAIKYNTKDGYISIKTEIYDNKLRINIQDTGHGITEENIKKLFEPFNRLGAESSNIEGTGIGLIICKKLVEKMGGQLGVESTIGKGSTFWVELPTLQ